MTYFSSSRNTKKLLFTAKFVILLNTLHWSSCEGASTGGKQTLLELLNLPTETSCPHRVPRGTSLWHFELFQYMFSNSPSKNRLEWLQCPHAACVWFNMENYQFNQAITFICGLWFDSCFGFFNVERKYFQYLLRPLGRLLSNVWAHVGDRLPPVELCENMLFEVHSDWICLYKKRIGLSVVFDLSHIVKTPRLTVCIWIQWDEFQHSALLLLHFFFWHPSQADICQRRRNVFLICSIKQRGFAFWEMSTQSNRNTKTDGNDMYITAPSKRGLEDVIRWSKGMISVFIVCKAYIKSETVYLPGANN